MTEFKIGLVCIIGNVLFLIGYSIYYFYTQRKNKNKKEGSGQGLKEKEVKIWICMFPVLFTLVMGIWGYCSLGEVIPDSESNEVRFYALMVNKGLWTYITPHLTACVGYVTFWAFWAQMEANKIQQQGLKIQQRQYTIDQIESTFFRMLELHRDNVQNMKLNLQEKGIYSGEEFISKCLNLILDAIKHIYELKSNVSTKDENYAIVTVYKLFVYKQFNLWAKEYDVDIDRELEYPYTLSDVENLVFRIKEELFVDIHNELRKYFVHLYQIVVMIDKDKHLTDKEKWKYLHILRAQLSPKEQLLIFYNWYTGYVERKGYGLDWENNENQFLTKWQMVKHYSRRHSDDKLESDLGENVIGEDDILSKILRGKDPEFDMFGNMI
ncbi:putative phage abortive infection protein [Halosquirtibacter xylanolyticus]|uniref:putative phage abortive infection protein n=1 Tax=Halosquirtibacter xylanolyticus TaxID=3374599 RepID=UPI0037481F26|nr:putative phage abortive infection protein [Prolixibacteraceae bacterium]